MVNVKETKQVYRCNVCGNIVEVLHVGGGELVCCDQPMELLEEKNEDEGLEKHVPIIEKTDEGVKVKVGTTAHPMKDEHYIEWIEVIDNNDLIIKFLKPGEVPEAEFETSSDDVRARAYCNVHGLWKS